MCQADTNTTRNKTRKTHKTWYGEVCILQKVFKEGRVVWDKEGLRTVMIGGLHEEDVANSVASGYVRGQDSKGTQVAFFPRKGKLTLAPYLLTFSSLSQV